MKCTILFRGKSYPVPRRYYWMAIDDDGEVFAFKHRPVLGSAVQGWVPLKVEYLERQQCAWVGLRASPKNWRTAIYRLEREK